jgi:heptosyltransferase-2
MVSVSWLGDAIMALPALVAFRRRVPHAHLTMLSKPGVAQLWRLVPAIDDVLLQEKGFQGLPKTVWRVKEQQFDFAYVFPRSFRSAVIPCLAGVPGRRGLAGHSRDWMLTETICLDRETVRAHQSREMAKLLGVEQEAAPEPPFLAVPEESMRQARRRLADTWQDRIGSLDAPLVAGFFPGAAHGPSKRWPAEHFVQLGRRLLGEHSCRILVLGARDDREICAEVAAGIGRGARNLAGATSLALLAALLKHCRVVVSNDSGGMHLAAALGARVVGLFGVTDPARTAPLGTGHRLVLAPGVARSRDLPPDSEAARHAMASIQLDEVYEAVVERLGQPPPG